MATGGPTIYDAKISVLVKVSSFADSIPFSFTAQFTQLLELNQYVCKNIKITDKFLLIIPLADLEEFLNDPVSQFPQVLLVYVYYENNQCSTQDQNRFQAQCVKLKFCLERDLPKKLEKLKIDNAIHPSRPIIDRPAIHSFASTVTERISAKRPNTARRHSAEFRRHANMLKHGFSVKNIEQINLNYICPICKLIFREPCQLCCGHRICQSCINIENDGMSCSTCSNISSAGNIWFDKGFERDMKRLLVSCLICDWTEALEFYQEHINQVHPVQEDDIVNMDVPPQRVDPIIPDDETHQRPVLLNIFSLRSIHIPSNNDQHHDTFSLVHNSISILSNNINLLTNDQQRISNELYHSQSLLQVVSKELSSLKSSLERNMNIANGIKCNYNFLYQEICSLKQMVEDTMVTSFDGTFLWKITCVQEKLADAQSERRRSIYSPPFYSSQTGYKMCMRLYLNGDEDVRGTYVSLFFVLMRNNYDAIVKWPFLYKVTFCLIDQSTLGNNQNNYFWPDGTSPSFQRPVYNMNEGYGIKKFFPLEQLKKHQDLYMNDNIMFIKVETDFLSERPVSLANSGTGERPNDERHINTTNENLII